MTPQALKNMLQSFRMVWDKPMSEEAVALYLTALEPIPDDRAEAVTAEVIRTAQYWPVPAVIYRAYLDLGDDWDQEFKEFCRERGI